MYTNADSLFNKMGELSALINSQSEGPSIIAVTEFKPKCKNSVQLSDFSLPGFQMFSNIDDENTRGILIYVKKGIECSQIELHNNFAEYIAIKIKGVGNDMDSLLFCCCYRSPSCDVVNSRMLFDLLGGISAHPCDRKIVIGDFNFPGIDWVHNFSPVPLESEFLNAMYDNFLLQHVCTATRARYGQIPHVLDLVLTNYPFVDDIDYCAPLGKSDHCVLNIKLAVDHKLQSLPKYNYSKGNYVELNKYLTSVDWNQKMSNRDNIENLWHVFKSVLIEGVRKYIPLVKDFNKNKKWKRPLSPEIRQFIAEKHSLWKKYIQSKDPDVYKKYKKIRNKVSKLVKQNDANEQLQIANSCKTNPKKFWNFVNKKTKCLNAIPDVSYHRSDGSVLCSDSDLSKANIFNEFFSDVFNYNVHYDIADDLEFATLDSIDQIVIDQVEVTKRLKCLNVNKSAGVDEIHPRVLREVADSVSCPLKILFETSMLCGSLPDDWKSANISAVHKKGKKCLVDNYRPISLTSIVVKLFESIVRDRLMQYFLTNHLFSDKQFGFIKGRSTTLQLLNILDDWSRKLEIGGQVDVVYTDLEKAFDKVPHRYLLHKVEKYGVTGNVLNWIRAFLNNRRQRVVVNGAASDWTDVISGIPQGSVLGPLLFVIYINDLVDIISNESCIYLYADDTKLYRHIRCDRDRLLLQQDLNDIVEWINKYLLKLNVNKCKVVSYGKNVTNYVYNIDSVALENLVMFKDLGVIFDSSLKFSVHITDKIKKANNMLLLINRNFKHLSPDAFLGLYKSLVRSHLEYAVQAWCPYRKGDIEMLERVQMRATKMIHGLRGKSYTQRLMFLKLPTLKYRRFRGDMITLFKILCTNVTGNENVAPPLNLSNVSHTRGNRFKLVKSHVKYDLCKNMFTNRIVDVWNGLPDDVVSAPTLGSFKSRLDKFWQHQCMLFDWEADITGTGNRSLK